MVVVSPERRGAAKNDAQAVRELAERLRTALQGPSALPPVGRWRGCTGR